jgi:hypothetical protein
MAYFRLAKKIPELESKIKKKLSYFNFAISHSLITLYTKRTTNISFKYRTNKLILAKINMNFHFVLDIDLLFLSLLLLLLFSSSVLLLFC